MKGTQSFFYLYPKELGIPFVKRSLLPFRDLSTSYVVVLISLFLMSENLLLLNLPFLRETLFLGRGRPGSPGEGEIG